MTGKEKIRRSVRIAAALLLALMLCPLGGAFAATRQPYVTRRKNETNFRKLLTLLNKAYNDPSQDYTEQLGALLAKIRAVSETDEQIARSVTDHWFEVYVDHKKDYPFLLYEEGADPASALALQGVSNSPSHAIIVLGYELRNGEMQEELILRCQAAAAMARAFPETILVCSGGPTGGNNPRKYTEAGRMKEYLSETCGIDPDRIFIDEAARSTTANAINTFLILKERGVRTITIVTSDYHQRWGQVLYNAEAALYRAAFGLEVEIRGNYSVVYEPEYRFRIHQKWALSQLSVLLGMSSDARQELNQKIGFPY